MAIAAQRFTFLDAQTNVPVANMLSQTSSDLLNSAQNDLKQLSTGLTNLLSTNALGPIQNALLSSTGISSIFSSLGQVRLTKDFFSSGINLLATPSAVLSNAAKSLAGTNPNTAKALTQLSSACQNSVLGGIGARKAQNPLISCGATGMSRQAQLGGCDLNKLSAAIAAQSGGTFNPTIYDQFNLENAASLLGAAGYKSALCGVFSALTSSMTSIDSVSRIASNLLGITATSGDIKSVIDIGTSLTKGNVPSIIPGISSLIFSNYQKPSDSSDRDLSGLYTGLSSAMTNIDSNWSTDALTGSVCTKNLGGSNASNYQSINSLLLAGSGSDAVSPTLDGSVSSASLPATLYAANQFTQTDVASSLMNNFSISI